MVQPTTFGILVRIGGVGSNAVLRLGYFPLVWRLAQVVAIPKRDRHRTFPQIFPHFFVKNEQFCADLRVHLLRDFIVALATKTFKKVAVSANPVVSHFAEVDTNRPPSKSRIRRVLPMTTIARSMTPYSTHFHNSAQWALPETKWLRN